MKYTIISLNDERKSYKDNIRKNVGFDEVPILAVDGNYPGIQYQIEARDLAISPVWPNAKLGEIGVWLSNFDRWNIVAHMNEPLVVFEDDAIVSDTFNDKFNEFVNELPSDWDFAALWVPENQRIDYLYDLVYEDGIPRINGMRDHETSLFRIPGVSRAVLVYQGYGMVSLMYSPTGGKRLVELARKYGITGPVDCWIYEHAHRGNLKGYAPHPDFADIVTYDWSAVSHVQLTERIN